jgi:prepilin-type N-terminal cleavage/methylation domain-containing protein
MANSLNSDNSVRTISGARRRRTKRGFTLLELVVALVVLGILAALAVPTYLTVIGNAKSAVATSDALSVATDAVAIASGTDNYATEANFHTAANVESSNVTLATPSDGYNNAGPGASNISTITLAVTLGSGVYDVVVSWPDAVNAAPYISSVSGGSTTTTTLAGFEDLATCSVTVSGTLASVPYTNDTNNYSLTCSGVTGPEIDATMLVNGTYYTFGADSYAYDTTDPSGGPYTSLPASFTVDYTGGGAYTTPGPAVDPWPITARGTTDPGANPAGTVGLYDSSGNPLACYNSGCGTLDSSSVSGDAPPPTTTTTTTTTIPANGPPTDIVAAFTGVDGAGNAIYNVSWTPGTGSDGSALYTVSVDGTGSPSNSAGGGIKQSDAPASTCGSASLSTSCVLVVAVSSTTPSSFTPYVDEYDGTVADPTAGSLTAFTPPYATPPVPTDLAVVNNGDGSFTATWTAAYPGDTYSVNLISDNTYRGDDYSSCQDISATSCTFVPAESSAYFGAFKVEVGETDGTYGVGNAFSADVPNP